MKALFFILVLIVVSFVSFRAGQYSQFDELVKENHIDYMLYPKCFALQPFYQRVLGYDSAQIITFMDQVEVNFCYPNQWKDVKFKLDSLTVKQEIEKR